MKIQAQNARQFVRHIENLAKIAGIEFHEAETLYNRLVRFEAKAHRIAENECNLPDYDDRGETERIKAKVEKLFNGQLKGFFINGDPRGYALKIKDDQASEYHQKGINIYQDFGGYGILAPEF